MAQKVEVRLIDDLDGGEAQETVSFALDGAAYEIDLSVENAERLRGHLAPFAEAARRIGSSRRQGSGRGRGSKADGPSTQQVRTWAKEHGVKVNERGRIPADVYAKFQEAQAS